MRRAAACRFNPPDNAAIADGKITQTQRLSPALLSQGSPK
jgi:hypothetical protein